MNLYTKTVGIMVVQYSTYGIMQGFYHQQYDNIRYTRPSTSWGDAVLLLVVVLLKVGPQLGMPSWGDTQTNQQQTCSKSWASRGEGYVAMWDGKKGRACGMAELRGHVGWQKLQIYRDMLFKLLEDEGKPVLPPQVRKWDKSPF